MHELYELKEKLMDELAEYGSKEMSAGSLEVVDKLTHTIKNLCKIIEDMEGYSEEGGSYEGGRSNMMGGSYARTGSYARGGNRGGSPRASYADGRGRGSNAQRDSRGRYSSGGSMVDELRELMEDAPDSRTRMEFERFIKKMESM